MHGKAKRDAKRAPTRHEVIPVKGRNIRGSIPGVLRFWTNESKGEICVFAILGMHGRRTGRVSGLVSSF